MMKEHIDNHHVIGANMDGKADRAEETGEGQKLGGFGTFSVYLSLSLYIYICIYIFIYILILCGEPEACCFGVERKHLSKAL